MSSLRFRRTSARAPYVVAVAWGLASVVVALAAARWTVELYYGSLRGYADGAAAPRDLDVFLRAADKVLHGASPYAFHGDRTFAYPPFLAYLLVPLHALSSSAAGFVWTLLSLAAVAAALWLLDVRDWRCYSLCGVYLFTRSAVDLGTIEPLLLLAVAAAWRWRERVVPAGVAIGIAIVLKLFLCPLAVWLALTKRVRGAATAVVVALALAFVAWTGIAFAGLGAYPGLLHKLANQESTSSYSVVALGVRAHLPLLAARIVSLLVAVALLAAAAWVGRDDRRPPRDHDVAILTLCLAAALAASPIVWLHYFLLLLVPVALARPRFSLLWLVPFAYYPLDNSAWPVGDARKLAIALAATVVILGSALIVSLRPSTQRSAPPRLPLWSRVRSGI
jgi:Glycosyltransferase family 87